MLSFGDFEEMQEDGLQFACELDGLGGASPFGWADLDEKWQTRARVWVHLDAEAPRAREWLTHHSGLSEVTSAALLAEQTRPRMFHGTLGVVTILRGINTNADAEPEDMVGLRLWSDGERVISLRRRPLMTPRDVFSQLIEQRDGPVDAPGLYVSLISRLCDRITGTIGSYDEKLDGLELDVDLGKAAELRHALGELRQGMIQLRRYIAPQRDALQGLLIQPPSWLARRDLVQVRETADQVQRFLEELDAARERSILIKEDVTNRLAESTNRTLYILSIVSAVFLPLGFLTGLLGMNVGGLPGVDNGAGFWIASGAMLALVALELYLFKRLKWLG